MHLRQGERAEDNDKDLQVDFPEAFCGYVRQGEGRIGRLVPVDPEELLMYKSRIYPTPGSPG